MREFPQRLENQPIFYPVVNLEYARQIARDWNTPDAKSGFSGFVTKFEVSSTYLSKYELHTAGSAAHREYWIPAKELNVFNKAINGQISVEEGFLGRNLSDIRKKENGFKGLKAVEQFSALLKDNPIRRTFAAQGFRASQSYLSELPVLAEYGYFQPSMHQRATRNIFYQVGERLGSQFHWCAAADLIRNFACLSGLQLADA